MKKYNMFKSLEELAGSYDLDTIFDKPVEVTEPEEAITKDEPINEEASQIPIEHTKVVEDKPEHKIKGKHAHLSDDEFGSLKDWVEHHSKSDAVPNEVRAKLLEYHKELTKEHNERQMSKEDPSEDLSKEVGYGAGGIEPARNPS